MAQRTRQVSRFQHPVLATVTLNEHSVVTQNIIMRGNNKTIGCTRFLNSNEDFIITVLCRPHIHTNVKVDERNVIKSISFGICS